jgi:hypothetical protein
MKPRFAVILIGLGALFGLIFMGWHLGSPSTKKTSPSKPPAPKKPKGGDGGVEGGSVSQAIELSQLLDALTFTFK